MEKMPHPTSSTTTVAILGPHTLVEDSLARLLEDEGYSIRLLEASPVVLTDELLDGVDLLLVLKLKDGVRESFLATMRSLPKAAGIPVLWLSFALKQALLDELSAGVCWRIPFAELVRQIEAALERIAAGTRSLPTNGG